jgi:hypothetical protein
MTDKPGHHTFRAGEDASPEDVPPYFQNHPMLFTAGTDIQHGQLVTPSEKDGKLYPIKWQREQNDRNEAVDLAVKEVATGVSASQVREDLDVLPDNFLQQIAESESRRIAMQTEAAIDATIGYVLWYCIGMAEEVTLSKTEIDRFLKQYRVVKTTNDDGSFTYNVERL